MTFVLKNAVFLNSQFGSAMQKITRHPGFAFKTSYNAGRIASLVDQQQKVFQEAWVKTIKAHAVQKPEGGLLEPQGPGSFQVDDAQAEAFKAEQEALTAVEFTIERYKLAHAELEGVGLTPGEVAAIDAMLEAPAAELKAV